METTAFRKDRLRLPQELISLILDYLVDDIATLRSCSLVSRSFCSPSQRILFHSITFHEGVQDPPLCDRLHKTLLLSPHLSSLIKELRIYDCTESVSEGIEPIKGSGWLAREQNFLPEILPRLINLRYIHVAGFFSSEEDAQSMLEMEKVPQKVKDSLFEAMRSPTMTHLTLQFIGFPTFDEFLTFLCEYIPPSLNRLDLAGVEIFDPEDSVAIDDLNERMRNSTRTGSTTLNSKHCALKDHLEINGIDSSTHSHSSSSPCSDDHTTTQVSVSLSSLSLFVEPNSPRFASWLLQLSKFNWSTLRKLTFVADQGANVYSIHDFMSLCYGSLTELCVIMFPGESEVSDLRSPKPFKLPHVHTLQFNLNISHDHPQLCQYLLDWWCTNLELTLPLTALRSVHIDVLSTLEVLTDYEYAGEAWGKLDRLIAEAGSGSGSGTGAGIGASTSLDSCAGKPTNVHLSISLKFVDDDEMDNPRAPAHVLKNIKDAFPRMRDKGLLEVTQTLDSLETYLGVRRE